MTQTNRYSPRIQVSMTDLDVLEKIQCYFGFGNILPIKKRQPHWKDAWIWRCSGDNAVVVMDAIYPYMSARRKEKIDEVRKVWHDRLEAGNALNIKIHVAATEYLAGDTSLRKVAEKYGVSHESVRRSVLKL